VSKNCRLIRARVYRRRDKVGDVPDLQSNAGVGPDPWNVDIHGYQVALCKLFGEMKVAPVLAGFQQGHRYRRVWRGIVNSMWPRRRHGARGSKPQV